jgi:hypothetical protein
MSHKLWVLPGTLVLAACASPGVPSGQQSWRCEHGIDFRVRFVDDSALLEGPRTRELLFRDAGGQGPQQTVYSNAKMRAEFGLGANGREALLTYPALPLKARCVRD